MPYGMGIKHLYGTRYILFVVGTFCVVFMFGIGGCIALYANVFYYNERERGGQECTYHDEAETEY